MWWRDTGSTNDGKNITWEDQDKNHYVEVLSSESLQHFFPGRSDWKEVIWIVVTDAQNVTMWRICPNVLTSILGYIPHFRFSLVSPRTLTWTLTLEVCCFTPQLFPLFQLENHIWFADRIACLIKKKKKALDFESRLITLCYAQNIGKVVRKIKR